jgi:predicted transposase/invertase (TIGR01784 family)
MLLTEWSMDTALKVRGEEYWEKGRIEGRMEGREEGWKEGKKDIARKMKADGTDVNTIAKWTGLTIDDVLRL